MLSPMEHSRNAIPACFTIRPSATDSARTLATVAHFPPQPGQCLYFRSNAPARAVENLQHPYKANLALIQKGGDVYVWSTKPPELSASASVPSRYRPYSEEDARKMYQRHGCPIPESDSTTTDKARYRISTVTDDARLRGHWFLLNEGCHRSLAGYYRRTFPELVIAFRSQTNAIYAKHTTPTVPQSPMLPDDAPDFMQTPPDDGRTAAVPHERPTTPNTFHVLLRRDTTQRATRTMFPERDIYSDINVGPWCKYLVLPSSTTLSARQAAYLARHADGFVLHADAPRAPLPQSAEQVQTLLQGVEALPVNPRTDTTSAWHPRPKPLPSNLPTQGDSNADDNRSAQHQHQSLAADRTPIPRWVRGPHHQEGILPVDLQQGR